MAAKAFTQGRVRLNEYGARETLEALDAHLGFLLDARATVIDVDDARRKLNARIEHTRRVIEELERTTAEQGWSQGDQHGELQRSHA